MRLNLPNLLSATRIVLVPFIVYFFLTATAEDPAGFYLSGVLLALSGVTDMLDGMLARKLNMITQLGKILDPLADKLTQLAVIVCLWVRFPKLWPLVALLIAKEVLTLVGSIHIFRRSTQVEGSKWFGKLYTVVFYIMTVIIVAFPGIQEIWIMWMLLILACFMAFSLLMYIHLYVKLKQNKHG